MDNYEAECTNLRKENKKLLDEFRLWLKNKDFSVKTITNHVNHIDFYINEFLLYEEPCKEAKDGCSFVDMFLGYWFIRKAMYASVSQIKSYSGSLKKFYSFMYEKRLVSKEDITDLKGAIKEDLPRWCATMKRYDDPNITDLDEVW